MKYKKEVIKLIEEHCRTHKVEYHQGLNAFLDFLIETFDISYLNEGEDGFEKRCAAMAQKSKPLAHLLILWMMEVTRAMEAGTWIDFFGEIYEEMYQSKGKASMLGQFFTPQSLCDLMSDMTRSEDSNSVISDSACGSGRTLISALCKNAWKGYYIGEDIDIASVKMCALNLMIHGARGKVVQHDTLRNPATYHYGFEINEVLYPFPTQLYSLRQIKHAEEPKNEPTQLTLFQ